ncbi:hypothetical protein BD311DRAFT_749038 [Dichomitus squalens]|uniref:Uncharacterized protein n=1 Tax=Dichomitus squalens TaxID=114155 RepID=A0A4Q9MZU7_9APHY|nr:hypothetical protein BD311DRAFT_749038 [Dichomitus squalens]
MISFCLSERAKAMAGNAALLYDTPAKEADKRSVRGGSRASTPMHSKLQRLAAIRGRRSRSPVVERRPRNNRYLGRLGWYTLVVVPTGTFATARYAGRLNPQRHCTTSARKATTEPHFRRYRMPGQPE